MSGLYLEEITGSLGNNIHVTCVKVSDLQDEKFTVGKIYPVTSGAVTDDGGTTRHTSWARFDAAKVPSSEDLKKIYVAGRTLYRTQGKEYVYSDDVGKLHIIEIPNPEIFKEGDLC